MSGITLTEDECGAAAFAVAHLIDKHGYSSVVSRTAPRVGLDDLYAKLTAPDEVTEPEAEATQVSGSVVE